MIEAWWFLATILVLAIFESLFPRYRLSLRSYLQNHFYNLSIGFFSFFAVTLVYKNLLGLSVTAPAKADDFHGLWIFGALLAIDLTSWCWHFLNHKIGGLWRSHRVHHSDLHLISSSSIRFHPFEVVLGNGFRLLVAWSFALTEGELMLIQYIYFVQNTIQHSNLVFPLGLEKFLSLVFVTPRMHHLHHSEIQGEQGLNLGTIFSFWDRLFGRFQWPKDRKIIFGLYQDQEIFGLVQLIRLPLRKQT